MLSAAVILQAGRSLQGAEMPMTILYNPLYSYASKKRIDWKPYPLFYMDFRPDVFRVK